MIDKFKNLAGSVLGGGDSRSRAGKKSALTRDKNKKRRSASAKKGHVTRSANARRRSLSAKRGATTRSRRKARVDAMLDAMRRR